MRIWYRAPDMSSWALSVSQQDLSNFLADPKESRAPKLPTSHDGPLGPLGPIFASSLSLLRRISPSRCLTWTPRTAGARAGQPRAASREPLRAAGCGLRCAALRCEAGRKASPPWSERAMRGRIHTRAGAPPLKAGTPPHAVAEKEAATAFSPSSCHYLGKIVVAFLLLRHASQCKHARPHRTWNTDQQQRRKRQD